MTPTHHVRLMFILGALAALGPFAIDMYLPGFEAIAEDFGTDIAHVGLSLTSYFVGICIGQIFCGPLVDRYGRRVPILVGLCLFMVASVGCGLATGLYALVSLRFLLALGGCVGMVASRAIIRDLYSPEEMPKVFSTLMLVMGVAPILAPTAGSYLVVHFGWRSIFVFLTLFSAAQFASVYFFLPESRAPDPSVKLTPGAVMLDYKIVAKNREFAVFGVAGGLCMAALFAYISGAPLLFLKILNMDPTHFAWLFGLNALGFIGAAQLNRVILNYISPQRLIIVAGTAATVLAAAICGASVLNVHSMWIYAALIFLFMSCLGPLIPNTTALALKPFSKFAGSASALIGSLQMLFAALASGAVSATANGTAVPMGLTMLTCVGIALAVVVFGAQEPLPQGASLTAKAK